MDEPEHSDEPPPQRGGRTSDGLIVEILDPDALLDAAGAVWLREHARLLGGAVAERFGGEMLGGCAGAGTPRLTGRLVGEVRVRVVDDAAMSAAHECYTGVVGTTDVLTFDLSTGGAMDVDVLVCVDEARRRGRELGHSAERELLLYTAHAMLHCLGYDDHDESGFAAMHGVEDELLEAIGVGAVFTPRRRGVTG